MDDTKTTCIVDRELTLGAPQDLLSVRLSALEAADPDSAASARLHNPWRVAAACRAQAEPLDILACVGAAARAVA